MRSTARRSFAFLLLLGCNLHLVMVATLAASLTQAGGEQASSHHTLRKKETPLGQVQLDRILPQDGSPRRSLATSSSFAIVQQFDGLGEQYVDESATFAVYPSGAAGRTTLVSVTASSFNIQLKDGTSLYYGALTEFFQTSQYGSNYDSKVVYDEYANRFVIVTLNNGCKEAEGMTNSTLFLAVSKTGSPVSSKSWYIQSIPMYKYNATSKKTTCSFLSGVGVALGAIYVTSTTADAATHLYRGQDVYIITKADFYNGGKLKYSSRSALVALPTTTNSVLRNQVSRISDLTPVLVCGGPVGNSVGTFLVGYNNLALGNTSYLYIVTLKNPLGSPTLSSAVVNLGQIHQVSGNLPIVAQAKDPFDYYPYLANGTNYHNSHISAVWRNNALWVVLQVVPFRGPNANQIVVKWIKISTDTINNKFTLVDQGEIGAKDLGNSTFTYYPAVAVNKKGVAAFGFSAAGVLLRPGAYVAGRAPTDPKGNVSKTYAVKAGIDITRYWFKFGYTSSVSVDPVDDSFWVYNMYADKRDSAQSSPRHDSKYGTAWGRFVRKSK